MEREIKFRAKSKSTNKFIYGVPITTHIGTYMVYEENPHVCSMYGYMEIDEFELIDDTTLGQYRCKKDKNKNEIYDGDIVEYYDHDQDWETGEIEFSLKQYVVGYEGDFVVFNPIPDLESLANIYNVSVSELTDDDNKYIGLNVIGNIYDNPELIEE